MDSTLKSLIRLSLLNKLCKAVAALGNVSLFALLFLCCAFRLAEDIQESARFYMFHDLLSFSRQVTFSSPLLLNSFILLKLKFAHVRPASASLFSLHIRPPGFVTHHFFSRDCVTFFWWIIGGYGGSSMASSGYGMEPAGVSQSGMDGASYMSHGSMGGMKRGMDGLDHPVKYPRRY